MRININGFLRDMTPEEIAVRKNQSRLNTIAENRRPLTTEEVSRLLISQQINALEVDDNTALRMLDFYPEWVGDVSCAAGFKVTYKGKLWRALQAHTTQSGWEPENAPSLWEQINETYGGTLDDPIPYDGNMALTEGSYYLQSNVIYLCSRDTVNPVYQPLSELVGLYVTIV